MVTCRQFQFGPWRAVPSGYGAHIELWIRMPSSLLDTPRVSANNDPRKLRHASMLAPKHIPPWSCRSWHTLVLPSCPGSLTTGLHGFCVLQHVENSMADPANCCLITVHVVLGRMIISAHGLTADGSRTPHAICAGQYGRWTIIPTLPSYLSIVRHLLAEW